MQLTEKQVFMISPEQKRTLQILRTKYHYNTSQFIRQAIDEKLQREKQTIFKQYKEVQEYLKNPCPFLKFCVFIVCKFGLVKGSC